ncbi:MAG: hypothetical protein U9R58_16070 [Chloroflexota bacterium]|nr:hypothetical protein [Chloroflexota bacterium]
MNKRFRFLKYFSAIVLISLFLLGLLFFSLQAERSVQAAGPIYVDDDTCPAVGNGSQTNPFCSIQDAVEAASAGDEIHVAGGTYTGTYTETSASGIEYVQVVFIDRALTLRGGYNADDWAATPDRAAHPSVIDAQRFGRGITIVGSGSEEVIIDGFTITGGDYTDLGNPEGISHNECVNTGWDCGGGLYAYGVLLQLQNSLVWNNYASRPSSSRNGDGGGIYLYDTMAGSRIESTRVISNSVSGTSGTGGGLGLDFSEELILWNCTFSENYAANEGGGAYVFQPNGALVVQRSQFVNNTADDYGGGLKVNIVEDDNGLFMDRVLFQGNKSNKGAGLFINKQGADPSSASLENLMFIRNEPIAVFGNSAALHIAHSSNFTVTIKHATAVWNNIPNFLFAESDADPVTLKVDLYNTLVADVGIAFLAIENGSGQVEITHTNTFTSNISKLHDNFGGSPTFTAIDTMTGDPRLDHSGHIQYGSDAIDAGVAAGLQFDIDSEQRVDGAPDIGADEYYCHLFLPLLFQDQ